MNPGETLGFEEKGLLKEEYSDDVHPLYLYLLGDKDMRSDVILNHPDVLGYIYVYENNVRKAFLAHKVINFKASSASKKNSIVAVSGDTQDYIPFSVPEVDLFSDVLHITDCIKINGKTPQIGVGRFIKDNTQDVLGLPEEFDTDAKIRKLKVVSFPLILPIVKGYYFEEGPIEDDKIYDTVSDIHDLYAEWIFLYKNKYIVNSSFTTSEISLPTPETVNTVTSLEEVPIKVLFKVNNDSSSPFAKIKKEVDNYIAINTKHQPSLKVPEVVNIPEHRTVASESKSAESTVINEKLTAFLQVLFAKPVFDNDGDISYLEPATISDNLQEIMTTTTNTSQQARMVTDAMKVLLDEVSGEKHYISRNVNFPFMSSTIVSYALQAHYHTESIDVDIESLKKSFNLLALLPPPRNQSEEYCGFVNSSKNVDVDRLLDQPEDKKTSMRKDVFIKGRQESIEDVLAFISNITVYTRFWVKMWDESNDDHPMVIEMFLKIADYLSSAEYRKFDDRFNKTAPHMYHTLVCYIFNIFSSFVKIAKNPTIVRKFKIENKISFSEIQTARIMAKSLLEQLHLCTATSSLQMIFSSPPVSYKFFFPVMKEKKRTLPDKYVMDKEPFKKMKSSGYIQNLTGRKLMLPRNLDKKYCSNFLDAGRICRYGKECFFSHAVYPTGFTPHDKVIMEKYIRETDGLSEIKDKKVSQD